MSTQINYISRDFNSIRKDLIDYAKAVYPDKFIFFNDSNPDILYLEMCAYVGDQLNYYIDKTFNEAFLPTAQARESLVRIANTLGFFNFGASPSETQVTLTIQVPYKTISGVKQPDPDLLPNIKSGMLLQSDSGIYFEVLDEVNFSDQLNRNVIPNYDGNNVIVDFKVEKTVKAIAGQTKIQKYYVSPENAIPFLNVTLDDVEVTQIIGVANVLGNQTIAPLDADFINIDSSFFEVKFLSEDSTFVTVNPITSTSSSSTSYIPPVIKTGKEVPITKRFITRRDVNDLVTLTFGSSIKNFNNFFSSLNETLDPTTISYNEVLNNTTLGEIPLPNSTLFIKYRTGAGAKTNTASNQINTIVGKQFYPASTSASIIDINKVRNTLTVRNDIPALGGKDILTNEEIRQTTGNVFSSQDRGVTYDDIKALIETIPLEFGKPFRVSYEEIKPAVLNYQQVENGVNSLLDALLLETTQVGRQLARQDITNFLSNLRNVATSIDPTTGTVTSLSTRSVSTLNNAPSLWIGEKARLYILGISETGELTTAYKNSNGIWISPNDQLKQNIRDFLTSKRIIGDWIDIVDARVINIRVEFTVLVDKKNKQNILIQCLNKLKDYFNINNWELNQPIFKANIITILQEIDGVVNVVDLKIYNIFGVGDNSLDPISNRVYQPFESGRYRNNLPDPINTTNNLFEMRAPNNIILGYNDSIFQVRYINDDIIGKAL